MYDEAADQPSCSQATYVPTSRYAAPRRQAVKAPTGSHPSSRQGPNEGNGVRSSMIAIVQAHRGGEDARSSARRRARISDRRSHFRSKPRRPRRPRHPAKETRLDPAAATKREDGVGCCICAAARERTMQRLGM